MLEVRNLETAYGRSQVLLAAVENVLVTVYGQSLLNRL